VISKENLDAAIEEAERFLKRAKRARKAIKPDDVFQARNKLFAAAKRASLDLSNALVTLRSPYNWRQKC